MNISARTILKIDTISKGNNKPWDNLIKYMEDNCPAGTLVEFDFRGIEVVQPCNSTSFLKLLSNPDFGMVMYNNENTVNSIRLMCTLNNYATERIRNVNDVIPKVMTAEEKAIERMSQQLLMYFETSADGKTGFIDVTKRFDQIGQPATVKYILAAVEKYSENTGVKEITVHTKMMNIQPSVIEAMANMVDEMHKVGVELTLVSDDKSIQDKLDMSLDLGRASYSNADKLRIAKNRLTPGRVGLLTKYKDGKVKDEFGRQGKGEKVMVRVAIFRGFYERNGYMAACFQSFNVHKFYTKQHWYLENDQEILDKVPSDEQYIPIDELGIYNDFIGTKYHFSSLVQYGSNGSTMMYSINESGSAVGTMMTIPERAKAVFDDFDIEYEEETLLEYIKETRRILGE